MCCFSRPVADVSTTRIFARGSKNGHQFLAYSMQLSAKEEVAMILPIPVPKDSKETAVRFINLEKYPDFFLDLESGFPVVSRSPTLSAPAAAPVGSAKLKVVEVGSFAASFIPSLKDFSRVDERFRLPMNVWDKLPKYKEYGFAVFQLKKGELNVHPMAFDFPRSNPHQLFFPTVHIHDGTVKPKAKFDHTLYAQSSGEDGFMKWQESPKPAGMFMRIQASNGLINADAHCFRKVLTGEMKNEDILV